MDFILTACLCLALLGSAAGGLAIQKRLHERHLTRESVATVQLLMGMLVTFSALVLGLLVSSAKERFDDYNAELGSYSTSLIELNHRLRVYGPAVDDIRRELRRYTAAAIAESWPGEPAPDGDYPRPGRESDGRAIESRALGAMITDIDRRIGELLPGDTIHQQLAERLRERVAQILQARWRLILTADSSVSWPFLLILTAWLSVIFVIFGLTAPRNGLVLVVIGLAALSIASPLYLILDYSGARSGLLQLSSDSMREALANMDRP